MCITIGILFFNQEGGFYGYDNCNLRNFNYIGMVGFCDPFHPYVWI